MSLINKEYLFAITLVTKRNLAFLMTKFNLHFVIYTDVTQPLFPIKENVSDDMFEDQKTLNIKKRLIILRDIEYLDNESTTIWNLIQELSISKIKHHKILTNLMVQFSSMAKCSWTTCYRLMKSNKIHPNPNIEILRIKTHDLISYCQQICEWYEEAKINLKQIQDKINTCHSKLVKLTNLIDHSPKVSGIDANPMSLFIAPRNRYKLRDESRLRLLLSDRRESE
jgi:hypothetical protein